MPASAIRPPTRPWFAAIVGGVSLRRIGAADYGNASVQGSGGYRAPPGRGTGQCAQIDGYKLAELRISTRDRRTMDRAAYQRARRRDPAVENEP
jgi:hypothetical protein